MPPKQSSPDRPYDSLLQAAGVHSAIRAGELGGVPASDALQTADGLPPVTSADRGTSKTKRKQAK